MIVNRPHKLFFKNVESCHWTIDMYFTFEFEIRLNNVCCVSVRQLSFLLQIVNILGIIRFVNCHLDRFITARRYASA